MEDAQYYGRAIKVTMLMFGPLAEKMGTRHIEVNMPDGTTLIQLAERFELEGMLNSGMRVQSMGLSSRIHLGCSMTRPKLPSYPQFQAVEG